MLTFVSMTIGGARLEKQPAVYIVASRRNGTIYIGVTSHLLGRTYQHREGLALIEKDNPTWRDLAEDLGFDPLPAKRLSSRI